MVASTADAPATGGKLKDLPMNTNTEHAMSVPHIEASYVPMTDEEHKARAATWTPAAKPDARIAEGAADPEVVARFWSYVALDPATGCLNWQGGKSHGYGQFHVRRSPVRAHRFAFYLAYGWLPAKPELVLDHRCNDPSCCSVHHLRAVPEWFNVLRSETSPSAIHARATHCPGGHAYSSSNLIIRADGQRDCRECSRKLGRERKRKKRANDPEYRERENEKRNARRLRAEAERQAT